VATRVAGGQRSRRPPWEIADGDAWVQPPNLWTLFLDLLPCLGPNRTDLPT